MMVVKWLSHVLTHCMESQDCWNIRAKASYLETVQVLE